MGPAQPGSHRYGDTHLEPGTSHGRAVGNRKDVTVRRDGDRRRIPHGRGARDARRARRSNAPPRWGDRTECGQHPVVRLDVALDALRAHGDPKAPLPRISDPIARAHGCALRNGVHGNQRRFGVGGAARGRRPEGRETIAQRHPLSNFRDSPEDRRKAPRRGRGQSDFPRRARPAPHHRERVGRAQVIKTTR